MKRNRFSVSLSSSSHFSSLFSPSDDHDLVGMDLDMDVSGDMNVRLSHPQSRQRDQWCPSGLLKTSSFHSSSSSFSSSSSNPRSFLKAMLMYTILLFIFITPGTMAATKGVTTISAETSDNDFPSSEESFRKFPMPSNSRLQIRGFDANTNTNTDINTNPYSRININQKLQSRLESPDVLRQVSRLINWKSQSQLGHKLGHKVALGQTDPVEEARKVEDDMTSHSSNRNSVSWHSKEKRGFSVISRLYPYIVGRDRSRKGVGGLQQRSFLDEDTIPTMHMRRSSMVSQRPYRFRLRWG